MPPLVRYPPPMNFSRPKGKLTLSLSGQTQLSISGQTNLEEYLRISSLFSFPPPLHRGEALNGIGNKLVIRFAVVPRQFAITKRSSTGKKARRLKMLTLAFPRK